MADVQTPDDRHYLQTAFSIVFSFTTHTEQQHIFEDEHEKPAQVFVDQEYVLLNKQHICHISPINHTAPAVEPNKQGCV